MDPTTTTTDTTAPAETPAVTNEPGTAPGLGVNFTPEQKEQVNAIVKQRLAEDRARRAPQPQPVAQQPQAQQPAPVSVDEQHMTPKQMRDELNELKLRSRFDKLALKRGIDGDAADDMFELFRVQKPTDDGQWFDDKVARFGFDKQGQPAAPTATTATATATTEAPKPAAAPAAPSTHALPTANGVPDLFNMTPTQHQAIGPAGVRKALEELWRIGNQMSGAPERPKVPTSR